MENLEYLKYLKYLEGGGVLINLIYPIIVSVFITYGISPIIKFIKNFFIKPKLTLEYTKKYNTVRFNVNREVDKNIVFYKHNRFGGGEYIAISIKNNIIELDNILEPDIEYCLLMKYKRGFKNKKIEKTLKIERKFKEYYKKYCQMVDDIEIPKNSHIKDDEKWKSNQKEQELEKLFKLDKRNKKSFYSKYYNIRLDNKNLNL